MNYYVAVDIDGRLSPDYTTLTEVQAWMEKHNPESGDCVVWKKPKDKQQPRRLAAYRQDKTWVVLQSEQIPLSIMTG